MGRTSNDWPFNQICANLTFRFDKQTVILVSTISVTRSFHVSGRRVQNIFPFHDLLSFSTGRSKLKQTLFTDDERDVSRCDAAASLSGWTQPHSGDMKRASPPCAPSHAPSRWWICSTCSRRTGRTTQGDSFQRDAPSRLLGRLHATNKRSAWQIHEWMVWTHTLLMVLREKTTKKLAWRD
jgi:hypothetical protein